MSFLSLLLTDFDLDTYKDFHSEHGHVDVPVHYAPNPPYVYVLKSHLVFFSYSSPSKCQPLFYFINFLSSQTLLLDWNTETVLQEG